MLPESVADAVVAQWHKQVGELVEEGENIVDLETDKVMLEVPATHTGVIESIHATAGETVESDQLLLIINESEKPVDLPKSNEKETVILEESDRPMDAASKHATPSARRAMSEHDVGIDDVKTSDQTSRVTKEDVMKSVSDVKIDTPAVAEPKAQQRSSKRVAMTRIRSSIAKRLKLVQQETAMLTTFNEVNMKPIIDLRTKHRDQFEKVHGVKLGFMSFFVKSVVHALKQFPQVNASIQDNDVIYYNYYDIGIAVSTERGLVVPIVRDVDQMSMAEIEKSIIDMAVKSRQNKLAIEDMQGGTFTITNGGIYGSMLSTPILNAPQSAILGMHNITKRAVVNDQDEIVVRPMMYLALTYDHRLIDGENSVKFLLSIKQMLEDPARFVLEI